MRPFAGLTLSYCLLSFYLAYYLFILTLRTPQPDYYAALSTGEIKPLHAYSEPVLTNQYIRSYATQVARSVFNLSFANYQKQLEKASGSFTPAAWAYVNKLLLSQGYIKALKESKLIMNAFINGSVVIVWQGEENGHFLWRVQMPVSILYEGPNGEVRKKSIVQMAIVRVPSADNPRSILVNEITMS